MSKSLEIVTYDVSLEFYEPLVGGNPYSDTLFNDYVEALASGESNPIKRALKEQGLATEADIRKFIKKATNTHFHEGERIYLKPYHVRAALSQSAIDLGLHGSATGRLHGLITRGLNMPPRLYVEGAFRFRQRAIQPVHMGRRQASVAILEEAAPGAKMTFTIGVVADRELTEDRLRMLLEYAGRNVGLGSMRPLDCGRFNVVHFQEGARQSLGEIQDILEEDDEGILPELAAATGNGAQSRETAPTKVKAGRA